MVQDAMRDNEFEEKAGCPQPEVISFAERWLDSAEFPPGCEMVARVPGQQGGGCNSVAKRAIADDEINFPLTELCCTSVYLLARLLAWPIPDPFANGWRRYWARLSVGGGERADRRGHQEGGKGAAEAGVGPVEAEEGPRSMLPLPFLQQPGPWIVAR
eukprot:COSAG01_NODE_342_length_18601_cov_43.546319_15_plen_158_part_00